MVPRSWQKLGLAGFAGRDCCSSRCLEEWAWDALVWQERTAFFGSSGLEPGELGLSLLVPLLSVPQLTHYLLDALVWRTSREPALASRLGWSSARPSAASPAAITASG